MKIFKIAIWVMLLLSFIGFSGCVPAMILAPLASGAAVNAALSPGDVPSFQGTDSLVLETARPDILDIIADTGTSLDYRVASLSKEINSISLSTKASTAEKIVTGGFQLNSLMLSFKIDEDGKMVNINFVGRGKKYGTPEGAKKGLEEFKTRFSEKLRK